MEQNTEQKYFTVPTEIGRAKLLAHSIAKTKLDVITFAVGDANGEYYKPDGTLTELKHERWRGPVTDVRILENSPNVVQFTTYLDGEVSGFTMREMSVIDKDGHTIAMSNTPAIEKAGIIDGVPTGLTLKMQLIVDEAESVNLTVDPNIIVATKTDLQDAIKAVIANINALVGIKFDFDEKRLKVRAGDEWVSILHVPNFGVRPPGSRFSIDGGVLSNTAVFGEVEGNALTITPGFGVVDGETVNLF